MAGPLLFRFSLKASAGSRSAGAHPGRVLMCTVFLVYRVLPDWPLVLLANRDEYFNRPSQAMAFWPENPKILAGKDLQAGGSWLGLNRSGRVAALTNFRTPGRTLANAPTRGHLVPQILEDSVSLRDFITFLQNDGERYNGFNLLFGNIREMYYFTNQVGSVEPIGPGIYGLSNHGLNTPWPKVELGKKALAELTPTDRAWSEEHLLQILKNRDRPPDHLLPDTQLGLYWERRLSSIFIPGPEYGTRNSTIIKTHVQGFARVSEFRWNEAGEPIGQNFYRVPLSDKGGYGGEHPG